MDGSMFAGLDKVLAVLFWGFILMLPLAIWKIIDIIIWAASHLTIHWK